MLTGCPTFRTFLLDVLLAIDPKAAASIGRGILASPTTADEWALALGVFLWPSVLVFAVLFWAAQKRDARVDAVGSSGRLQVDSLASL